MFSYLHDKSLHIAVTIGFNRFTNLQTFLLLVTPEGIKLPVDENIVTWNVTNWITVVLMAAVGLGILALAQKYIASKKGA